MPVDGTYQLFFLYSLQSEQDRLDFLQRTLGLAAVALVVLLGSMTWLVTRQTVRPVRRAAEVAERLADGHLSERMPEKGEDEMATLARSFNEMADSLQDQIHRMEELSTLQRRFVSDVSHELRTPLTTIRMAGEVIHASREDFDPAAKRSAELLQTQLDRFEDLLADLLEISRFDAGAAVLDAEGRDVRDVVVQAVDHASPLAERRGAWLHVVVPEERCVADIDPRRVERILRNLLVNAVEHAEGSTVEVTVGADAHAVAVTVRDHGVGMTPDEAAHVFDRFWRADPARARTTGGTGLGLAISLEDAHLHGGWLEAWGRPGRGASFRLTLPRRAGIRLTGSPLPLAPDESPITGALRIPVVRPHTDPAALPDMASDELDDGRPAGGPMSARRLRRGDPRRAHRGRAGRLHGDPDVGTGAGGRRRGHRAVGHRRARRGPAAGRHPDGDRRRLPRGRRRRLQRPVRDGAGVPRGRGEGDLEAAGERRRRRPAGSTSRPPSTPRSPSTSRVKARVDEDGRYAEAPPEGGESVTFDMVQDDDGPVADRRACPTA